MPEISQLIEHMPPRSCPDFLVQTWCHPVSALQKAPSQHAQDPKLSYFIISSMAFQKKTQHQTAKLIGKIHSWADGGQPKVGGECLGDLGPSPPLQSLGEVGNTNNWGI